MFLWGKKKKRLSINKTIVYLFFCSDHNCQNNLMKMYVITIKAWHFSEVLFMKNASHL